MSATFLPLKCALETPEEVVLKNGRVAQCWLPLMETQNA